MWVTSQPLGVEEATEVLKEAVSDLDVYVEKGQIEIISYTDWYVKDCVFEIRKDGSLLWVLVSAKALFDDDGKFAGALSMYTDITERKKAEEELLRKEEELNEAQRIAHVGSWYWDAKTDENIASDELLRIYGQPCPPFKEQKGTKYPPETWERLNEAVQRTLQTGVGYELDLEVFCGGR